MSTFGGHPWSSWTAFGNASLVLALLWSAALSSTQGRERTVMTTTLTAAMIGLTVGNGWTGSVLPAVGFGGSAVVALFVLAAGHARLQMRT